MSFRSNRSFRYDGHWRKVRALVLERDGYVCQIKGPGCTKVASCVDHIVPVKAGGALYDEQNLRACCKPCNEGRAPHQLKRRPSRDW